MLLLAPLLPCSSITFPKALQRSLSLLHLSHEHCTVNS